MPRPIQTKTTATSTQYHLKHRVPAVELAENVPRDALHISGRGIYCTIAKTAQPRSTKNLSNSYKFFQILTNSYYRVGRNYRPPKK